MSILVSNIKMNLEDSQEDAVARALAITKIDRTLIKDSYIYKKSLDARKRDSISYVASVVINLYEKEAEVVKSISDPFVMFKDDKKELLEYGKEKLETRIAIIGFGPAGIFAAKALTDNGYDVVVFERGDSVENRVEKINDFWKNAKLDTNSNVQFGEGGAGTFSDGKLTTRISDFRCRQTLEALVEFGAPQEILKTAKPHIGTDKLRDVIKNIRNDLIKKGTKIYFNRKLEAIKINDNKITGITVDGEDFTVSNLILAIGHSARDTFEMIEKCGIAIESKPFSVGVRIEHLQTKINEALYGQFSKNKLLPPGEYQMAHRVKNDAVYTFCMCPGGVVVPATSNEGCVVTNGMSEYLRNQKNANSALVVSVDKKDFGQAALDGMRFQQRLEEMAFVKGGRNYKAPAMTVDNFLKHKRGLNIKSVKPSYSLGVNDCTFNEILPQRVCDMLRLGILKFDQKVHGFAAPDAVLTGVETRTSSPIRILRNEEMVGINVLGLYPCGEGAGYAGGIVSAAVDGIKTAESIMRKYAPNK